MHVGIIGSEESFVRSVFKSYYEKVGSIAPTEVSRREFGVGGWDKKIEHRHLSFKNWEDLRNYLVRNTPFYISYSAAYYEFPSARPMSKKNWLGADIIFDLDADQLSLECVKNGEHSKDWVCHKCLERVKEEVFKLIENFLIPDFGFSKEEIYINFSGNRGYHIHLRREDVRRIGRCGRRQIVDYITGNGLRMNHVFLRKKISDEKRTVGLYGPRPSEGGWRGKIARAILNAAEERRLEQLGMPNSEARKVYRKLNHFRRIVEKGVWEMGRIRSSTWERIVKNVGVRLSDDIDKNVTIDIAKLIRLPDSLHGGTGLSAKYIKNVNLLEGFDPMDESVVLPEEPVKIRCLEVPEFIMKGRSFGPFTKGQEVELPMYAAVYLLCKRKAKLWG